jgi:BirA family transcriptional regulator, biotin operon repressor / biotin---[acetyl-CoA-carboxylase] ligase
MVDESARRALVGTRFADIRWFPEVGSTNSVLAELARAGAHEGVVVVADHQTAGRGRLGRTWEAAPGAALLVSVLLRPDLAPDQTALMTIVMALAASAACEEVAGVKPLLKWPNDLTVADRKLGGILGETVPGSDGLAAVVGLGLNVTPAASLPAVGVALEEVAAREVSRSALLIALLRHFDRRYGGLQEGAGVNSLLADYRASSSTLGRQVRVELPGATLEGEAVDLTGEGHLVIDLGGTRRVISTGDVVHVHPPTARGPAVSTPGRGRPPGRLW